MRVLVMLTGGEDYHEEEGAAVTCDTSAVLGRTATLTIMTLKKRRRGKRPVGPNVIDFCFFGIRR